MQTDMSWVQPGWGADNKILFLTIKKTLNNWTIAEDLNSKFGDIGISALRNFGFIWNVTPKLTNGAQRLKNLKRRWIALHQPYVLQVRIL